jgi:hypothetical protein
VLPPSPDRGVGSLAHFLRWLARVGERVGDVEPGDTAKSREGRCCHDKVRSPTRASHLRNLSTASDENSLSRLQFGFPRPSKENHARGVAAMTRSPRGCGTRVNVSAWENPFRNLGPPGSTSPTRSPTRASHLRNLSTASDENSLSRLQFA